MVISMIFNEKDKTINGLSKEEYEIISVALKLYEENTYTGESDEWQQTINELMKKIKYLENRCRKEFE